MFSIDRNPLEQFQSNKIASKIDSGFIVLDGLILNKEQLTEEGESWVVSLNCLFCNRNPLGTVGAGDEKIGVRYL